MIFEVIVPEFAEGATVIRLRKWLCQKGEKVDEGTHLAEAATAKIEIYIEAAASGYVHELLAAEGDEVRVGQVIAQISSEASEEV